MTNISAFADRLVRRIVALTQTCEERPSAIHGASCKRFNMKTADSLLEQFDAAYANVTTDRRDVYGDPQDTYRRISTMRQVVDECPDPQIREILGMIVTKVARLIQTPDHLDSWVDVAGYSRCGVMLLDERGSD